MRAARRITEAIPEGFMLDRTPGQRTRTLPDNWESKHDSWEMVEHPILGEYRRRRINHGFCVLCLTRPEGGELVMVRVPVARGMMVKLNIPKAAKGGYVFKRVARRATAVQHGRPLCDECGGTFRTGDLLPEANTPSKPFGLKAASRKRNTATPNKQAETLQSSL